MSRTRETLLALLILVLAGGLVGSSLWTEGPTYDEPVYLMAGHAYLTTGRFDLNPEHPPLWKELAALPLCLAGAGEPPFDPWNSSNVFSAETAFRLARLPGLLLFLGAGWALFCWSWELWGAAGGFLSLFLYAFDPNLMAFSGLVTPDFPVAAWMLLALHAFWRVQKSASPQNLIWASVTLGFALACRYTALILLPLFLFFGFCRYRNEHSAQTHGGGKVRDSRAFKRLGLVFVGAFMVLAMVYGIVGIGHYFRGLGKFLGHATSAGHDAFLFGEHSDSGWWHYFLAAMLLKTPIPALLAGIICLGTWRKGKAIASEAGLFLGLPLLVYLLLASLNKVDLGLRLVLPVYPLAYLLIGHLATLTNLQSGRGKLLAACLVGWCLVGNLRVHPHYISYFNELVGPEHGHHYLVDSNIDWGQDLPRLGAWMRENQVDGLLLAYFGSAPPGYYGIRHQFLPTGDSGRDRLLLQDSQGYFCRERPRLLAISVTLLKGVPFEDHETYSWLEKRQPMARIGASILVYDITEDRVASEALADIYRRHGLGRLAEEERGSL